jgi:Tripartite tricarboxylate transporter family receptor
MKLRRRQFLQLAAGAAALPAMSGTARAQAYPTRPVTMIIPFAAGGGTDVIARIAAEHMSRTLGQQVIIENVAGAGGTTGSLRAMRANPDGHTIEMGHMGTHAAPFGWIAPEHHSRRCQARGPGERGRCSARRKVMRSSRPAGASWFASAPCDFMQLSWALREPTCAKCDVMGHQSPSSHTLSEVREIGVTLNRELPTGRAEACEFNGGEGFPKHLNIKLHQHPAPNVRTLRRSHGRP